MNRLDKIIEKLSRRVARNSSRRTLLKRLGLAAAGGTSLPLLPVARAAGGEGGSGYHGVSPQTSANPSADPGDPASCDYWRYCAIDGFLCSCCGGTHISCPPGTAMSPLTWIGTCKNPVDGLNYIVSYNDCCGKTSCSRCLCNNNVGDTPPYRAFSNNDINWCVGMDSTIYHCTTSIILGVATEES